MKRPLPGRVLPDMRRPPACRTLAVIILLLVFFVSGGCVAQRALRLRDGAEVPIAQMERDLRGVRLVFVGEFHKKLAHHRMQLGVIKALHAAGVKLAIGIEMFSADNQDVLDRWVAGKMSERAFRRAYYRNWNISWYKYRGIFIYARKHKIPLVGLNLPKKITHKLFTGGTKSLSPEDRKKIGDITCDVDLEYEKMIRDAMGQHSHMKDAEFLDFCRVQMAWDTYMASRIVDYLVANPGRVMVVLAGSGHAWKRGIPRKVRAAARLENIVILPEVVGEFDRRDVGFGDTDYLLLAR